MFLVFFLFVFMSVIFVLCAIVTLENNARPYLPASTVRLQRGGVKPPPQLFCDATGNIRDAKPHSLAYSTANGAQYHVAGIENPVKGEVLVRLDVAGHLAGVRRDVQRTAPTFVETRQAGPRQVLNPMLGPCHDSNTSKLHCS